MPIRIEHQPSAFAVGVAGYAAGRGASRERAGKYALDLFQDQQRFQQQQNMLNQRNQWPDDRTTKSEWETMPSLSKIPDWVDPETRKELADMAAAIRDTRRKFAYNDPNARQADLDLRNKYENRIGGLAPPSEAEAWNRGLTYVDENPASPTYGRSFDTPDEARKLVPYRGGQRAIDNSSEIAATKQQQADAERQRAAAEKEQADAERQRAAAEKAYAAEESRRDSWLTRRAALAKELRAANAAYGDGDSRVLSESQIMERATEQMISEGWGQEPRLPTLRPGEKPHMGSPALGPEITPLSSEEAAQVGGGAAATEEQPIVLTPGMAAQFAPTGQRATPGAAAALQDPNTKASPIPLAPRSSPQASASQPTMPTLGPIPDEQVEGMIFTIPRTGVHPYTTAVRTSDGKYILADWRNTGDGQTPQMLSTGWVMSELPSGAQYLSGPTATLGDDGYFEFAETPAAGARGGGTPTEGIPLAPRSSPQASSRPYVEEVTPIVRDWAEEAWPEPITSSGNPARQQFDFTSLDRRNERWADQFMQGGGALQQSPQAAPVSDKPPVADASKFTPEMLRQARRIAQTPAGRAVLKERYGVDFAMPDEQQQSIGPLDTTQRQHVEAMRGPQGTGEGIPSDAARIAGQVQGAGSLAGRTAGYARRDAGQLGPGQTRTTKYNVQPTADEREAAMNERWARAEAKRIERQNAQPDVLSMGVKPKTPFDEAIDAGAKDLRDQRLKKNAVAAAQARESRNTARGNAVAAQGIKKGIERAQRLGKSVPKVQLAIMAALMGDVAAQKALDEREIKWRA